MGFFSFDSNVALRHESDFIWISFPIIISIFMRYLYIAWNGIYLGDPTNSILRDKILQLVAFYLDYYNILCLYNLILLFYILVIIEIGRLTQR